MPRFYYSYLLNRPSSIASFLCATIPAAAHITAGTATMQAGVSLTMYSKACMPSAPQFVASSRLFALDAFVKRGHLAISTVDSLRLFSEITRARHHFADALKSWDVASSDTPEARLRQLEARVGIQVLANQGSAAKPECEQTRALLEARLAEWPEDHNSLIALAWAYVCLGRNADALRVARQAADLLPIEKDALAGPVFSCRTSRNRSAHRPSRGCGKNPSPADHRPATRVSSTAADNERQASRITLSAL
jgi:hypothetical protein